MKSTVLIIAIITAFLQGSCDSATTPDPSDFATTPDTSNGGGILFVSNESGVWHLYSMRPSGTGVKQITLDREFQVVNALWSPDGNWTLRKGGPVQHGHSTATSLYLVDRSGETRYECYNKAGGLGIHRRLAWSPDTTLLSTGKVLIYREHLVIDMSDCSDRKFSEAVSTNRTDITDVSNDGSRLLGYTDAGYRFYSPDEITHTRVSVWKANGDSLYSFGEIGDEYLDPIWSSSEEDIAFGLRRGNKQWLYRTSAEGNNPVQLTDDDYNDIVPVAWSADDTKILAKAREQNELRWRILLVDAQSGGVTDITPFSAGSSYPTSWLTN